MSKETESPRASRYRLLRNWRDRRARGKKFGISAWDQMAYENAARLAWRELESRDRNVFIADFDGATEPILMVFARRGRVEEVRQAVNATLSARKPVARSRCPHGRPSWAMCPHCLGING